MSSFGVLLSLHNYPEKGKEMTLIFDSVNDIRVSSSSTITEHPIVNGDIIADHIYKDPVTMDITGTFSFQGSKYSTPVMQDNVKESDFKDIQKLFESIKNEGVLCLIQKVNIDVQEKQIRFLSRDNMVLTSISWTESINTLGFTFNFRQVMLADVQTTNVDIDDKFLPNFTEPETTSFSTALLDWDQVDYALIQVLRETNLLSDAFLDFIKSFSATALIGIGVTAALAYIVAGPIIGAITAIPVAGWIVAGAAIFIIALTSGITALVNNLKYKIDAFKKYNSDKKNQKEVKRFAEFTGVIHQDVAALGEQINVYQIGISEEQEAIVAIDNEYYIFTFTKNNTNGKFGVQVTNVKDNVVASKPDVTAFPHSWAECTLQNTLFTTANNYVYIINVNADEDLNNLENCYIVASKINPEKFNEALQEVIKNALLS